MYSFRCGELWTAEVERCGVGGDSVEEEVMAVLPGLGRRLIRFLSDFAMIRHDAHGRLECD
jgi:hypothetical protein